MDDLTETGKRIRQLRLEKGWSQAQLGKEVGLNGRSVRDWELGTSLPSSKTLKKLSILLNTSADYILGLTDKETLRLDELTPNDQLRIKAILQTFKNLNLPS